MVAEWIFHHLEGVNASLPSLSSSISSSPALRTFPSFVALTTQAHAVANHLSLLLSAKTLSPACQLEGYVLVYSCLQQAVDEEGMQRVLEWLRLRVDEYVAAGEFRLLVRAIMGFKVRDRFSLLSLSFFLSSLFLVIQFACKLTTLEAAGAAALQYIFDKLVEHDQFELILNKAVWLRATTADSSLESTLADLRQFLWQMSAPTRHSKISHNMMYTVTPFFADCGQC
jgi:hypothetical protein